jgi:hypothetical protein
VAAVVTFTAVTVWAPLDRAGADPLHPAALPEPPLASTVLTQTLPGFAPVPAGPTNGPLTATEFASQSSSPQQAERQFAALASQPGFGAFIRLWTDRGGTGHGANDLAVLVFRIPDASEAGPFTTGLLVPFGSLHAAVPFTVPSVPGARGYSIQVTTPVGATEQVAVFRAGRYVSMIQLASTTSASNPSPLTRSQAVTLTYQQYALVRRVDPGGSAPETPPASLHPTTAPPATPTPARRATESAGLAWLLGLVGLACLAAIVGLWAIQRRRRGGHTAGPSADPWGPEGIFALFGAIDPRHDGDSAGPNDAGGERPPAAAAATGRRGAAQPVPALVPATPPPDWAAPGPVADPVWS